MAREWWTNSSGVNLLSGIEDDPTNPIRLDDFFIIDFLRQYEVARLSFNRVFPAMLPDERDRLALLSSQADYVYVLEHTELDAIQKKYNTAGVRTSGPLGGRRMQRMTP